VLEQVVELEQVAGLKILLIKPPVAAAVLAY
jgi:hypothetical protein